MRIRFLCLITAILCSLSVGKVAAQEHAHALSEDSTKHIAEDTTGIKWPSDLGGDLFLTGDLFLLRTPNYFGAMGSGLGTEIRLRPFFLASIVGLTVRGDGSEFRYVSIYGGRLIGRYRLEIGGTNAGITRGSPGDAYTYLFLGGSGKFGRAIFIEPEIRIMFPVVSRLSYFTGNRDAPPYGETEIVTRHYNVSNVFFGLGVKIGIGYN